MKYRPPGKRIVVTRQSGQVIGFVIKVQYGWLAWARCWNEETPDTLIVHPSKKLAIEAVEEAMA